MSKCSFTFLPSNTAYELIKFKKRLFAFFSLTKLILQKSLTKIKICFILVIIINRRKFYEKINKIKRSLNNDKINFLELKSKNIDKLYKYIVSCQ